MYDWYRIFLIAHPIFTIMSTLLFLFWLGVLGSLIFDLYKSHKLVIEMRAFHRHDDWYDYDSDDDYKHY